MDYLIKQNGDFFELPEEKDFYEARLIQLASQNNQCLHAYYLHPAEVLILADLEDVGAFMRSLNSAFARFKKNLRASKGLKKYEHKALAPTELATAAALINHLGGKILNATLPKAELSFFTKRKVAKFKSKKEQNMKISALDNELHRQLQYHEEITLREIAPSVMVSEALSAEHFYPLVFTNSEVPSLVALLGKDKNVMLSESGYVPASVANYPFFWISVADGKESLCIDEDAPQLQGEGIRLFNEDGSESEFFKQALEKLKRFRQNQLLHEQFLKEIIAADILVNKELSVSIEGSKRVLIKGFSVVDRRKLDALDDAKLADWARRGHLEFIHAHIRSLQHLNTLATRIIENEE